MDEDAAPPAPPAAAPKKPPGVAWDDVAKGAVAVTALVGALGALAVTGVLERVQRDHPDALKLALGLVVSAATVWAVLNILSAAHGFFHYLQILPLALFGAGLLIGLYAVVAAQSDSPRPRITGSLTKEGPSFAATVRTSGLHHHDHVRVLVESIGWKRGSDGRPDPRLIGDRFGRLYEAWLGPDASGSVEHQITLPLRSTVGIERLDEIGVRAWVVPALPRACTPTPLERRVSSEKLRDECGEYFPPDCYQRPTRHGAGCVRFRLTQGSAPRVTLTWEAQKATVVVKADGLQTDTDGVLVRAYAGTRQTLQLLGSGLLRPRTDHSTRN